MGYLGLVYPEEKKLHVMSKSCSDVLMGETFFKDEVPWRMRTFRRGEPIQGV